MVRKDPLDRKEAEAWTVFKAPTGPEDPREKQAPRAPQDYLPTPLILPWQKVPEVTQAFQGPMGSQEVRASQETQASQASPAYPSEMEVRGEACLARWAPKASEVTKASLHSTPAHPEQMESRGSEGPLGLLDFLDQMASCLA